jgi:hypothetical protein
MNSSTEFYDDCAILYTPSTFLDALDKNNVNYDDSMSMSFIVDVENSNMPFCNKFIFGNVILTLTNLSIEWSLRSWKIVKIEKREIYNDIFDAAIRNVKKCTQRCSTHKDNSLPFIIIGSILGAMFLLILAITISIFLCSAINKDSEFFDILFPEIL